MDNQRNTCTDKRTEIFSQKIQCVLMRICYVMLEELNTFLDYVSTLTYFCFNFLEIVFIIEFSSFSIRTFSPPKCANFSVMTLHFTQAKTN